jgi:aspartyl-tRNA(Asn)/glutamyl-tRNA(Gln) amidotransferase subunit C
MRRLVRRRARLAGAGHVVHNVRAGRNAMGISVDEVRRVAALAKLELDAAETAKFAAQLSSILDYIERLRQVDTTGVDPATATAAGEALLRPDATTECLASEAALANAPKAAAGHFSVPRVIG